MDPGWAHGAPRLRALCPDRAHTAPCRGPAPAVSHLVAGRVVGVSRSVMRLLGHIVATAVAVS